MNTARRTLVALTACVIGVASLGAQSPASAIVGGAPATITDGPWEVALIINGTSLCGGALISPTVIVTAAHCFAGTRDATKIDGYAGITSLDERDSGKKLAIASLVVHPGFDAATFVNDIAVLTLSTPVVQAATVSTIALPYGLDASTWPAAGTPARIAGWGVTSQTALKPASSLNAASVQLLTNPGAPCGKYGTSQPANILCAGLPTGGVDTCQGDSGSPLIVAVNGRPVLAGVTSTGAECAQTDYPGVYTSVPAMLGWLSQYAPQPASSVSASSPDAGRLTAFWTFSDIATPVAGFTATFTGANVPALTCTTTANSCGVATAVKGQPYVVSVTAAVPTGMTIVGQAGPVIAAFATGGPGTVLSLTRLKTIAGLKVSPTNVTTATKSVCIAKGKKLRLLKQGSCTVVLKAKGRAKVIVIAVAAR